MLVENEISPSSARPVRDGMWIKPTNHIPTLTGQGNAYLSANQNSNTKSNLSLFVFSQEK
jgi:hypothetical protein